MTLGPIDDPIEVVVTETLGQAVKRQSAKIDALLDLLGEWVAYATGAATGVSSDLLDRSVAELGDKGL